MTKVGEHNFAESLRVTYFVILIIVLPLIAGVYFGINYGDRIHAIRYEHNQK